MKAIRYRITTINPLIISSKRGDANMINTKSYIPGSSILGLLASLYIKNGKLKLAHKDTNFYNWFLQGNLAFTNAYITDDKHKYFPTPQSIKSEKYADNSIYDLMFEDVDKHTKSDEPFIDIKDADIYGKQVKNSISFHHAIEDESSKDGAIFNYESISEDQTFEGNIIGTDEDITEFYKTFNKDSIAYIGLSKNSQYGKTRMELMDIINYESEIPREIESGDTDIVMTLLSDAIIYNENGFSTANTEDLEKMLGVKIEESFIRKDRAEQFVGVWGLKKQSETVLSAGSCFKLKELPVNYEELQLHGIGEKTNEGFGRVVFGWQDSKVEYHKMVESEEPDKPKGEIPEIVKNIVRGIIEKRLKDMVVSRAMQDANLFEKLPTKSLCGKLQSLTNDIDKFQDNLKKVVKNEPAKIQLEKCNNKKVELKDYLYKNDFIDINSRLNNIDNLDEFTNPLKNNNSLKQDMKRLYLRTFFNFMRKNPREKK